MTESQRIRNRYLEECGTVCPECCIYTPIDRELYDWVSHQDARPEVIVKCKCVHCGFEYTETYILSNLNW